MEDKEVKVIDTSNNNGSNRCPNCGVSDVTYDINKKKLICNYCHTEFEPQEVEGIEKEAKNLNEEVRGSGTHDINANASDIITIKCDGCGAEIVINTKESINARCHWCRSILSINSQVENGIVPDMILPFSLSKEEAKKKIEEFVNKRKFFGNPQFKYEFTTDNIIGVYFPYMLVDANCRGSFRGQGGHLANTYTKPTYSENGNKTETVYDIDIYNVEREFDLAVDDLSIESSLDKLDKNNKNKTTNVINSIMPFDTENCTKYQANYLVGYNSERRDVNVSTLERKVEQEVRDIARFSLNNDLSFYDCGVRWDEENLVFNGKQWVSAYLPVWLYSYQDKRKVLHYVAVNGRTGETMGSVPMNKIRLTGLSLLIMLLFIIIPIIGNVDQGMFVLSLISGFLISTVFYSAKRSKYRNKEARHKYEKETKRELTNIKRTDKKVRTKVSSSIKNISGKNNEVIKGERIEVVK